MTASLYRPADRFLVRTPALPLEALTRLCADSDALRKALDDPEIVEAIYVASPDFLARALRWRCGAEPGPAVERGLVRYLSRMASRATPFGLFACVGVGALAGATRLELRARAARGRHTRLDNEYLFALSSQLVRDRALRDELRFVPNSSLYRLAGRWRYVEVSSDDRGRVFELVAVDDTAPLADAIRFAEPGATVRELADAVARAQAMGAVDVEDFVHDLIDAQLLVLELGPAITGEEPGRALVRALSATRAGRRMAEVLEVVLHKIDAIDAMPPGVPVDCYASVMTELAALPCAFDRSHVVQVDRFLDGAAITLGPAVVAEVLNGVEVLRRLAPEPDPDDVWARFRAAFRERYQEREVPLVEVLDDESGIGFGNSAREGQSSLLAGLEFHDQPVTPGRRAAPRGSAHRLRLYARALADQRVELELSAADLDTLAAAPAPLPDSFAMMVTVFAESAQAVDAGQFQIRIAHLKGPTATRILGRFCHGVPAIAELARSLAREEARVRAPAVVAEVVHLPAERVANILLRPVLRDHEIPFLGTSGAGRDHQIPVTDLLVSVIDDRVILRSARLGREIVPLLSAAHNYAARGLGVYRFLCALAEQGLRIGHWDWGELTDAPFLPRVVYGRLVLAPAQWLLEADELATVQRAVRTASRATTDEELAAARAVAVSEMAGLRAVRRLPRWVTYASGDHILTVDLASGPCIDSFAHMVKDQPRVRLVELADTAERLCATNGGAAFVHELVIPWIRKEPAARVTRFRSPVTVRRRFPPSSPWLYVKLYGGVASLDGVLRDEVQPLISGLRIERSIRRWFFVRYRDPDFHLRLRLELNEPELAGVQLHLAERIARLVSSGLVWRVQYDTYEREIDRYGGDRGIALSEALFDADSDAAIAIVSALRGHDDARWLVALAGMHHLLVDLGLALAERWQLITARRDHLGGEYGMTPAFQRELGKKFRAHEAAIHGLLADTTCNGLAAPTGTAGLAVLQRRSARLAPTVTALREAEARGGLTVPVHGMAESYLHMHANRVLMTDSRPQELVLCDFLRRYYLGQLHRR